MVLAETVSKYIMKAFVALTLFLGSQLTATSQAALPDVGACTFRELTDMERSCTTTFYQGFKKDPQADCSTKFTTFFGCVVTAVLKCRTSWTESQARTALQTAINEKRYCEDAGMQDPALHPNKNRVPCSSTYFQNAYGCGNETRKMFRANKGDARLCSSYAKAIKCEKALIEAHCWYTGVNKELIELAYDGYNPFCDPLTPMEKNAVPRYLPQRAFLIWAALITLVL